MQGEEYTIHVNPGYGKSRFSRRELGDIAISMIVLAVAFAILNRGSTMMAYLDHMVGGAAKWMALVGICLILVVFSFLLHEFGHKFVAQRYGMWSEYRMYPMGLVLTLVTSLMGFLFAAPGAVYISGYADSERNGKISLAGPIVNIVLAAIGIVVLASIGGGDFWIEDAKVPLFLIFSMLTSLNSFLAVFNLLPIPPLDGSKIISWNKVVWVAMIAVAAIELAYMFLWLPDFTIWYHA